MGEECRNCGNLLIGADVFCGNCGELSAAGLAADSPDRPGGALPVVPAPRATAAPRQDGDGTRAQGLARHQVPGVQTAGAAPVPPPRSRDRSLSYTAISGTASLDPLFNTRFHRQVLHHAALFAGLWVCIETLVTIFAGFLALAGVDLAGTVTLWCTCGALTLLVLTVAFCALPVPVTLAQWSLLVNHQAVAAGAALAHITEAIKDHEIPLEAVRIAAPRPPADQRRDYADQRRDYLELRQGCFTGFVSCFAHGRDLYVGWTFWLYLSPLRLLIMIVGRKVQDMSGRGDDIHQTLRYESIRATVAAMHRAVLEGIDMAAGDPDPAGRRLLGRDGGEFGFKFG